jgi:hypothetical protein
MLRRTTTSLAFALFAITGCNGGTMTVDDTGPADGGMDIVMGDMGVDHGSMGDTAMPETGTDGGSCGAGFTCNPITNAGCATGMACITANDGDGGTIAMCVTPGTGGQGAHCATADACMQGFACLGSPGTCMKLCCGAGDNATCRSGPGGVNGATCSIMITGSPFFACQAASNCDWFLQNCPMGGNCQPTDAAGNTTCTTAGTGTQGAACMGPCAAGFTCIYDSAAMTTAHCLQVCDPTLGATDDAGTTPDGGVSRRCPSGLTCGPVGMRPMNYGVCHM